MKNGDFPIRYVDLSAPDFANDRNSWGEAPGLCLLVKNSHEEITTLWLSNSSPWKMAHL